jgi:hypothetical protein
MHREPVSPVDAASPDAPSCRRGWLVAGILRAGFRGILLAAWAAAVAVPPAAFLAWRQGRLEELSRPAAQAEWDAFREAMRGQTGRDGPVQRKVPRSAEPPELVWLRDYPALAVTAWVVLVGVLGGCLVLLARGAINGRGSAGPSRRP